MTTWIFARSLLNAAILGFYYGRWGTCCYNFVIGVRLISEVFANLLVIGVLFGAVGSGAYTLAVVGMAVVAPIYFMLGGLPPH